MPGKPHDLHGSAPETTSIALLLIDVINDLDFADGKALLKHALPMARRIAALKRRAKQAGIPSIYVNDNFGRWQSDFQTCCAIASTRRSAGNLSPASCCRTPRTILCSSPSIPAFIRPR